MQKTNPYKRAIRQIKEIVSLANTEEIESYVIDVYGEESGEALIDVLNNDAEKQLALIDVVFTELKDCEDYLAMKGRNKKKQSNLKRLTNSDFKKLLEANGYTFTDITMEFDRKHGKVKAFLQYEVERK